jgi:hypothetical protein
MKTKLIRETDVLRDVCTYLHQRNYFFTRLNNIPAPGRALPKWTLKGLPDVLVLWSGIMICIEVKRPSLLEREPNGRTTRGGKLSIYQAEFATRVAINDGEYFCVHSVDELDKELMGMRMKRGKPETPKSTYGQVR